MNESLEVGSQLPYVERAQLLGFSVVVMNTNEDLSTPLDHALFVWQEIVMEVFRYSIALLLYAKGLFKSYATLLDRGGVQHSVIWTDVCFIKL